MAFGRRATGLVVGCAMLAGAGCDRGEHPGQLGKAAPVFTVSDGEHTVNLASLRGHVVVLNFWASWCPPCLEELPSLNAMQQELPEVRVIGVSIDDDPAAYALFLRRHPAAFETVLDSQGKSNALYGTYRPPETYVIDRNGVVRRKFIGPQDWTSTEITNYLKKLSA